MTKWHSGRMALLLAPSVAATSMGAADPAFDPASQLVTTSPYVTTPEAYGAAGDGKANDWDSVQRAVASCATHALGCACRVDFVHTYLSGPVVLNTSRTTLNISGSLLMLPKGDYPADSHLPFVSNANGAALHDIRVTGTGTLGNHKLPLEWWACKLTGCFRPHLIVFSGVTGVRIDGGLHLRNSPNHHIEVDSCTNVRVDSIDIKSPFESPNTDGINFYGGHDQSFTNSVVHNGDDCVSVVPIGEFSDPCVNGDPSQEACRGGNVLVHNVRCEGGHGIAIGGVRHGTVSNVTFRNMTATGGLGNTQGLYSPGGLRIKSYPNATGSVYDIRYEDIQLDGVYTPLSILTRYCPWPCKTPDGDHACQFHDIHFNRVRGSGRSHMQGEFNCSKIFPCYNITLNDVVLGDPARGSTYKCNEYAGLVFVNGSSPSACSKQGREEVLEF